MKYSLILILLSLSTGMVRGQKSKDWKPVTYHGTTYLCDGQTGSGTITKARFDSLITYGLVVKDSTHREYRALSYFLTYVERGLYEDSTGHLKIMADYSGVNSKEGKVPDYWLKSLLKRSKPGDTVIIDNVLYLTDDNKPMLLHSQPLKLTLTP